MQLLHWLSKRRFPYEPLISVRISRSRLLRNYDEFTRLAAGKLVAPVLKSNAYGHGLFEAAEILHEAHGHAIPFTVVDSYFEAVALRARGCRHRILIIGYTRPETISRSFLPRTAFTVSSLETLRSLRGPRYIPRLHGIPVHIKIDTGMRRQGILPEEIPTAIEILQNSPHIELEGICTHFCDADNADESFTEGQINTWNKAVHEFKAVFPDLKYVHAAATDGTRFSRDIEGNVTRLGIGLYGLSENKQFSGGALDLLPALEMRTIITGVKNLAQGETVGYGNTFRAECDMKIGIIPVGYYEGLDRRLSSWPSEERGSGRNGKARGYVLVGPSRLPCPIIGRVSMNITTIDLSDIPEASIGTEVVVLSSEVKEANSISAVAKALGTITYEVAVKIPSALKRVIVD